MRYQFGYGRSLALAGVLMAGLAAGPAFARAETVLSGDDIVRQAVDRAEAPATSVARPDYTYTKHTVTDELDAKGHVKGRKEKLYEVLVESGLSYLKLLQVNGRQLSGEQLRKQQEREEAERQKMTDSQPGKKGDNRENFLTAELVERYHFTLLDKQTVNGRVAYRLAFEPKSGLAVRRLTDRFLNQIAGTVWIDAEEFEIARAEIHLKSEVALWGGMVGTLKRCAFTLQRTRLPDGIWFNAVSHGFFEGRRLLEPMLIKTQSESTNFRKLAFAGR
jgi:hypothetical protein